MSEHGKCPFCGGEGRRGYDLWTPGWWLVGCDKCGNKTASYASEAEAWAAWDKRTDTHLSALRGLVDASREMLVRICAGYPKRCGNCISKKCCEYAAYKNAIAAAEAAMGIQAEAVSDDEPAPKSDEHECPSCGEMTTHGEDGDYCLVCEMQEMDQLLTDRDNEH